MLLQQAKENVEDVFAMYEKFGQADYIGEPVSQVKHMVQAAQLAEGEGYEEEVVLAAFFHDIGHHTGADMQPGFCAIAYLCFARASYFKCPAL